MNTFYKMVKSQSLGPSLLVLAMLVALPQSANAQDCPAEYDANESAVNYSLYWESFKNKDYETALPYLKWVLKCDPGFAGNKKDDRNYERATQLYEGLASQASDATLKRALLDTALVYFDTAVPALQEAGVEISEAEWILNKARFIQKNVDDLPDLQQDAGGMYREVFNMDPTLLEPKAYYINAIIQDYINKEDKATAIEFMEEAESAMGEDEQVMVLITDWRGRVFDDPEERAAFLEEQLSENPEDQQIVGELVDLYKDLQERDKLIDMLQQLMSMAPTAKVAVEIGTLQLEDGDANGAIEYFNQATSMTGSDAVSYEINFNQGIAHQQLGRLSQARNYFRSASRVRPDEGRPIKAIGDLYAETVRNCGADMAREDRAVYWLVADYLERAKRVDPALSSTVNRELSMYRKIFPAQEDLFFMNWKPGDTYSVNGGCYSWIDESTKVRNP